MGNGLGKIGFCFSGAGEFPRRRHDINALISEPYDEAMGHSFIYVRPDAAHTSSSKLFSDESTAGNTASLFRSISGASISANTSTPLSTTTTATSTTLSSAFESSTSFASISLQPIPRNSIYSGPLSGPITEPGFMSGPIERGFMSGPIDRAGSLFSGPLEKGSSVSSVFRRSLSQTGRAGLGPRSIIRGLQRSISKKLSRGQSSIVAPVKGDSSSITYQDSWIVENPTAAIEDADSVEGRLSQSLQWAQSKAGEDRVHVVVSEEHGWVFVGIYDGFHGPDATDFLLSNLYSFVQKELKGLLWDDNSESLTANSTSDCTNCSSGIDSPISSSSISSDSNSKSNWRRKRSLNSKRRWKYEWDRERIELDRSLKEQLSKKGFEFDGSVKAINHSEVLNALSRGLRKTEEAYFDVADKMLVKNPELYLMGSCVLVMLMKAEDVYVMNVGDSRAVLAQKMVPDLRLGKIDQDLERINEETSYDLEMFDGVRPTLSAFQLSLDHSTAVDEEVRRIRREHPDDSCAVVQDRVKGSLMVTRAFGAGYLKQPKWNDALLEMFRINYVGTSSYMNCLPSLHHHRLGPNDRFLILSSDGLYQYFTNEEAVSEVELFTSLYPDGDPAQHIVEELLFRAAKKAGMDFYELLEISQGERRRYHDDVSIIIISFEGTIWRSCV